MSYKYDVALSFAGEQRTDVEAIADRLRAAGVAPFYDYYEKANLWGKNLYEHLTKVYSEQARYCVVFVSEAYARKVWTSLEMRAAQARALDEKGADYILPVRYDNTELPGLLKTIGHLTFAEEGIEGVTNAILAKLGADLKGSALGSHQSPTKSVSLKSSPRAYLAAVNGEVLIVPTVSKCNWGDDIEMVLASDSLETDSLFARLRSTSEDIVVAYGFDALIGKIISATKKSRNGSTAWELKFRATQRDFHSQMEVAIGKLTAEALAQMRAERLLLDLHPQLHSDNSKFLDLANQSMIEVGIRGLNTKIQIEMSAFPKLWELSSHDPSTFLEVAWIIAVAQLKLSNCVEHISRLELSLNAAIMNVDFSGLRHKTYSNLPAHKLEVHGAIVLDRLHDFELQVSS